MNLGQKISLSVGLILVVVSCLFPPWYLEVGGISPQFFGYRPVLWSWGKQAEPYSYLSNYAHIELPRLLVQLIAIGGLGMLGLVLCRGRKVCVKEEVRQRWKIHN